MKFLMVVGFACATVVAAADIDREVLVYSKAGLSADDTSMITDKVPGVVGVKTIYWKWMVVERGGRQLDVTIIADERKLPRAATAGGAVWPLAQGEFVTDADGASLARVAVIGRPVLEELFAGADALGEQIRVGETLFRIKGVLGPHPAFYGGGPPNPDAARQRLETRLYVPFRSGEDVFFGGKPITQIRVSVGRQDRIEEVASEIESLLAARHGDQLIVGVVRVPPLPTVH